MKKIILRCVLCAVLCIVLVLAVSLLFNICVEGRINTKPTYIAAHDILPRTMITEEDLIEVSVPEQYLLDHTFNDKYEIVGKYTDIQGKIPAGSPFYKSMLYDSEDLPDYPGLQLREGQAVFSVQADAAAGSFSPGMRVNIHASVRKRDDSLLTDCLIENARILDIKDFNGLSVSDPESTGIPYLLEIAVNKSDLNILLLCEEEGDLYFFASSDSYGISNEAVLQENSAAVQYLISLMNDSTE